MPPPRKHYDTVLLSRPETGAYEEAKIPNKENSAKAVIENESRVEAMETLIGQTVVADGRSFIVESIHGDRASLRDTTFQGRDGIFVDRNGKDMIFQSNRERKDKRRKQHAISI